MKNQCGEGMKEFFKSIFIQKATAREGGGGGNSQWRLGIHVPPG